MKVVKKNLQLGLRVILKMNTHLSNLHSQSNDNVYSVNQVQPTYAENAVEDTDGRMILRDNFDAIFTKYPETLIFGRCWSYW
jgi:hypothetical protein